jgi:hypothetical protein
VHVKRSSDLADLADRDWERHERMPAVGAFDRHCSSSRAV